MSRLDSRQIEAFRALMLTASTVRAAAVMNVTQPAVSRLVKELQAALQLTPFERRSGVLRVAAMPALCNGFLPRFSGGFLADRPKLDFALVALLSHTVIDWVVSDQCDLGFGSGPIEHAAVTSEKMPAVRYVAVMPEGHRLAKRRASASTTFFHATG